MPRLIPASLRWRLAGCLGLACALTSALLTAPPTSAAAGNSTLPNRIKLPARTRQLVTVTSSRWGAKYAALRAWRRTSTGWQVVHGPVRVRLGYAGWVRAADRIQSTGTTPAGVFRLPYAFGRLADPGTHLGYRTFDADDWWPYEPRDPATYNVWQWHKDPATRWRRGYAEHLRDYPDQYAYAVVVGFNLPHGIRYSRSRGQWVARERADTDRGGGIFLHVNGDGLTAGCVSMPRAQMRWVVRWLRPRAHPRVAMGPRRYLVSL